MRPALALVLSLSLTASAQTAKPSDTGTVTGHILCADTQRPARLAEVRLVSTNITPSTSTKPNLEEDDNALGSNLPPVQTDLEGNYTIHNARPGSYYFRVDYTGYLTPIASFTRAQLARPTPDLQKRITSELTVVNVAPHATAHADASITRGAAIFGTVTYDDGSPAVGINLLLYRRNAKGEFKDIFRTHGYFGQSTVDHGNFRFDSLPADSFVVAANFSINESTVSTIPNPVGSGTMQINMQKTVFSLPLYSGDALRLHEATIIKTDEGQDAPPVNLSLPLSKLHSVSGTVTAKDGHAINAGTVALLYADNREELTNVPINREDGRFNFLYVPEGNYILAVQKAEDITQIQVPNPPGSDPKTHSEDKTLHTYSTAEQSITVQGDLASVLAIVTEKPATTPNPEL